MAHLAAHETKAWLENASQNQDETLPTLTIHNGAHPRSAGPRVDALIPVFQATVASPAYTELTK